jgi:hypothetical protein
MSDKVVNKGGRPKLPRRKGAGQGNKNIKDYAPSLADLPPERRKEIASMGGKAAGVVYRQRKTFKETLTMLLECPVTDEEVKAKLEAIGITDITQQTLMNFAVLNRAKTGDVQAATYIRDTIGEKEADKVDFVKPISINIKDDYGDDDK